MQHQIFVTGGTGFIGRWLVARLTSLGHTVWVLARGAEARQADFARWIDAHGGDARRVRLLSGDLGAAHLGLSSEALAGLTDVSIVYHLGAAFQWRLPIETARRVTVDGTRALMELARTWTKLERIVYFSGYMLAAREQWERLGLDGALQNAAQPLTEAQRRILYSQLGAYEAAKIESHFVMHRLAAEHALPWTDVLPSSVIGHSRTGEIDQPHGIPMLIALIQSGKLAALPGDARDWLPLVTVDYLVEFSVALLRDPASIGQSYVVLDQDTPSFHDLVSQIATSSGRTAPKLRVPKRLLKRVLSLGLGRLLGIVPETLDFVQPYRFDTGAADRQAEHMGLIRPDIRGALDRTIAFLSTPEVERAYTAA